MMQHLANLENGLAKCNGVLTEEQYKTAKKYGFQDKTIKRLAQVDTLPVENYRAGFKMVDTCAAEFSANTPISTPPTTATTKLLSSLPRRKPKHLPRASLGKEGPRFRLRPHPHRSGHRVRLLLGALCGP